MRIAAAAALLPQGLAPATITITDGVISEVVSGMQAADYVIEDGYLSPGLIDLQLNGAFGVDFAAADTQQWTDVVKALPSTGVTAFLPTIITNPVTSLVDQLRGAPATFDPAGAQPLGFHVEGPFISMQHRGVHREDYITAPTRENIDALVATKRVRLVTLAPEVDGALDAITTLADAGVIASLGHSSATNEQAHAGVDAGARMVTHLFNAMTGVHHREPGLAAVALTDSRITCGLIADGVHVHPDAIRLAFAAAPERIALVTDALAALGLPPGTIEFGGKQITIGQDGVARDGNGILAGSIVRMDHAIGNCISWGIPAEVALRAASTIPAEVLHDNSRGSIVVGSRGDLTWLANSGDKLTTQATWIGGDQVFAA